MKSNGPAPEDSGGDGKRDDLVRMLRGDAEPERAYGIEIPSNRRIDPDEMRRVLAQALGNTPEFCTECEDFCPHQEQRIRDAFLLRALALLRQLSPLLELYAALRGQEILPSGDHLDKIYAGWLDLAYLHDAAEPLGQPYDRFEAELLEMDDDEDED